MLCAQYCNWIVIYFLGEVEAQVKKKVMLNFADFIDFDNMVLSLAVQIDLPTYTIKIFNKQ